jgi:hypothetical protein
VALPVAAEIGAGPARHGQLGNAADLLAVGHAAAVLAPRGFLGVAQQIDAADMVVVADFGPAKAGEVFLRPIRAGVV